MEHAIALITGTTSRLGYAAARLLAGSGWDEMIIIRRNLARIREKTTHVVAET